jgi:hypothetical protein
MPRSIIMIVFTVVVVVVKDFDSGMYIPDVDFARGFSDMAVTTASATVGISRSTIVTTMIPIVSTTNF